MPATRKKAAKDIKTEIGAGASTAKLFDSYQSIARKFGINTDQNLPYWIEHLLQQPDPIALQIVLDDALDGRNMDILREFLFISGSEGARIRWMLIWRAIRQTSDTVLRLYRSWVDCRALQDLTRLHLLDCNLGLEAVITLAPFWKQAQGLRELQLDHNPALSEPAALTTLLDGICELKQLTKLSIGYCLLPINCSIALADLIKVQASLKEVNLEGNLLSDSGAEILAQAVMRSTPESELRFLNLSNNRLNGDIRMQQMIIAVSRSRHVLIAIHDVLQYELLMRPTATLDK